MGNNKNTLQKLWVTETQVRVSEEPAQREFPQKLKHIQTFSKEIVAYCTAAGIASINQPEVNRYAVNRFALTGILTRGGDLDNLACSPS
jgi:hypothetical protein